MKQRLSYPDLRTFLEKTRTTQRELIQRLAARGFIVEQGKLSRIVNGKMEPELRLALALESECGVPLESLLKPESVTDAQ